MLFTDMNCVTFGLTIGKCDRHLTCNVSSECSVPHFIDTFNEPLVQRYLLILNFRKKKKKRKAEYKAKRSNIVLTSASLRPYIYFSLQFFSSIAESSSNTKETF